MYLRKCTIHLFFVCDMVFKWPQENYDGCLQLSYVYLLLEEWQSTDRYLPGPQGLINQIPIFIY